MPNDEFNSLAEFRKRYPSAKLSDQEVYRGLANPDNFRAAFPEFSHLDNTTIGRNVAREAGTVTDTGKSAIKTAYEDVAGMVKGIWNKGSENAPQKGESLTDYGKHLDTAEKQRREEFAANVENRKKAGYSLPYRATANTLEGLGLFNAAPMEQAAAQGHTGEVVGHAAVPAAMAVAPLAVEGVVGAGRVVRNAAMEEPVVARQRAMGVSPRSKQAIRAQKEGTAAAPYLKGSQSLSDVQARIPAAKQEVFQPYMDAVAKHDVTGVTLKDPNGNPVTATELENMRQETSAQLQATRKLQPTDQQTILQKNQQIKALTDHYRAITDELDPAIKNQGIDPKRTRATFGAIKGVEKRFEGRSTLLENKPSGVAKLAGVDITKPSTWLGKPAEGARDIVAGRGILRQKPTDVQVREGFRTAGPKPDLTIQPQPPTRGLPPGPVVTPPPQPGPVNVTPPPVAGTSRAQRLGLILPEQTESSARIQIAQTSSNLSPSAPGTVHYEEAPPSAPRTETESPAVQPANMRIVRDPKTGRMKRQYLTSAGGQVIREEPVTPKDVMSAKPAELTKAGSSNRGLREYYKNNLSNPELVDKAIDVGDEVAVPTGGNRIIGDITKPFNSKESADAAASKLRGKEGFDNTRVEKVGNRYKVRWGDKRPPEDSGTEVFDKAYGYKGTEITKTGTQIVPERVSLNDLSKDQSTSNENHVIDLISKKYDIPIINKHGLRGVKLPFDLEVYHGSMEPIGNELKPTSTDIPGVKSTNFTAQQGAEFYSDPDNFGSSRELRGKVYKATIPKGKEIFTGGKGEAPEHIRYFENIKPDQTESVAPKISTDSMGIKWAETPDGIRVSIPKSVSERDMGSYVKTKLDEQRTAQAKIKGTAPAAKNGDTLEAYQKRIEANLARGGITKEKVNMRSARGTLASQEASVPGTKSTGIRTVDAQKEVLRQGLSDLLTPTEARKLADEFDKPEYKSKTPLMKRRFIMSQLSYGGQ